MKPEEIARINELARKSRSPAGLTEAEKTEQAKLRKAYIRAVTGDLEAQLEHTVIVEPDGTRHKLPRKSEKS